MARPLRVCHRVGRVSDFREAVAAGDLDRLVGIVDRLADASRWDDLYTLISLCEHATEERGIQLWPAAEYAEYRMALQAPGEDAGGFVVDGAGRNALGPLWEVAASTHEWGDLADHIPPGPAKDLCAHERVVRGERLVGDDRVAGVVLEVPLEVLPWEPTYPVATYGSDAALFPAPDLPSMSEVTVPEAGPLVDDDLTLDALYDLVRPWAEDSNGSATVRCVEGRAESAIAALGHGGVLATDLATADALAWMAWAGASGGAYARRRGTPLGRAAAWWVVACAADVDIADPDAIHRAAADLRWVGWLPPESPEGWRLHLAIEDAASGLSWVISAHDEHREGDDPLSDQA